MNETPPPSVSADAAFTDPMGLDDPALLAEIEAEFADLTQEIQRISMMPRSSMPEKTKMIEALRQGWKTRAAAVGERPEWRKKLDDTLNKAVDRLLDDGLTENPDGSIAFAFKGETLTEAGGPVIRSLLESFAHVLEERFPAEKNDAPATGDNGAPVPAATDAAAPQSTMQSLMGNLGQMLAGVLRNAVSNVAVQSVGASGPAIAQALKTGSGTFDIKMSSTPPRPLSAAEAGVTTAADPSTEVGSEQTINASLEMENRASFSNRPAEGEAKPDATDPAPPPGGKASVAANAFFAQLMAGIGQAMTKSFAVPTAPFAPQAAAPAPATEGAPAPTPEGAPTSAPQPPPQPAAPAANPLQNIGLMLTQALQKALTPGGGPITLKQVPPAPSPSDAGAPKPADPPPAANAEGAPTETAAAKPDAEKPAATAAETPKPTLQIDLAGIIGQLLAAKKPPST